jgi:hypothetical protein
MEYLKRISAREAEPDEQTDLATRDAQLSAITEWGIPDASKLNRYPDANHGLLYSTRTSSATTSGRSLTTSHSPSEGRPRTLRARSVARSAMRFVWKTDGHEEELRPGRVRRLHGA